MTRIVQCLSHAIEAHDQLKLYTELGYEAVDIGGYINPHAPHDPKRPPLPEAPYFPELQRAVDDLGTEDNLGAAQAWVPDAFLDWLGDDGVLIYHHYLERLVNQWHRIADWAKGAPGRRVIWRTVGQSVTHNEQMMAPLRKDGLEIVRYSPKERNIPGYAGEDALIRFWKDPDEWQGWTGEAKVVINITQHLRQREPYTNYRFWHEATEGLPAKALGPGSEVIGGSGELTFDQMKAALKTARAYLYTGTQPASYTLGLIEAMMTGIPVVSIGPSWMRVFPYGPLMFEGHEIVDQIESGRIDPHEWEDYPGQTFEDPTQARKVIARLLTEPDLAADISQSQRAQALDLFGKDKIAAQWREYLG
jgi:hypothetical protein